MGFEERESFKKEEINVFVRLDIDSDNVGSTRWLLVSNTCKNAASQE